MGVPNKPTFKRKLRERLLRFTVPVLKGTVCVSEECRRQILPFISEHSQVLVYKPFMIRKVELKPYSTRVRSIIYVGRIETNKGVFMLMDVFERLSGQFPDIGLRFVGDGRALEALKERVARSKVRDRVMVTGRLGADMVHEELAKSDLLICPTMSSFPEGLALVCLEAAAHGVPSIVSTAVPAQDVLGPACRVFDADIPEALEVELAAVIGNLDLYHSLAEGARSVSEALWDDSGKWGVQLSRLIESLGENNRHHEAGQK
jgi:glycosyltransferase involved in cell wall biosynthesis